VSKTNPCYKAPLLLQKGDEAGALKNLMRCKKQIKKQIRKAKGDLSLIYQLRIQLARAIRLEAQLHFSKNKLGKAKTLFEEANLILQACEQTNEINKLGGYLDYSLGLIASIDKDWNNTNEFFVSSIGKLLSASEFEGAIEVLFRLADMKMRMMELVSALEDYKSIDKISKKLKNKSMKKNISIKAKFGEAKVLEAMGSEKAVEKFHKIRKSYSKLGNKDGEIEVLVELAGIEKGIKSYQLLEEANDLMRNSESAKIKGLVLTRMGIYLLTTGEFEKGQEKLMAGLEFRMQAGDKIGTAQTLVELSRIAFLTTRNNDDLEKAKNFANQSLDIYQTLGHKFGEAQVLEMLGSINTKLGILQEAKAQVSNGRKIFKQLNDRNGEARMLTQLGIILDLQNRNEDVIPILERAEKIYKSTSNNQGLAEVYQLRGSIKSDKKIALEYLKLSRELYKDIIQENKQLQPIIAALDKKIIELEAK
jgi:tetratricopeptide (TPR) repeat protein